MSLMKTEGIILRRIRLGETSKILTVLSPSDGKIKMVAKGARKPKHRFGSSLEPFTVCSFVYYHREGRDLEILSQCDTNEDFPRFARSLRRLAYGSGVLELADKVVFEREPTGAVYAVVVQAVGRMAEAPTAELPGLWWAYQLKLLGALGYLPELNRCGGCGGPVTGRRVHFAPGDGTVRCAGCVSGGEIELSGGSLRALQFLAAAPWEDVRSLRASRRQSAEIETCLARFFARHFGDSIRIKSLGVLRSIPGGNPGRENGGGLSNADHAA